MPTEQCNFRCFCVGIDGSKDIIYAQKVAKSLGLELIVRVYNYNEVEKLLKKAVTILPKPVIEGDNYTEYIVKVTVSAVLLSSLSLGNDIFLSGIGAEELSQDIKDIRKRLMEVVNGEANPLKILIKNQSVDLRECTILYTCEIDLS